ncbi:restriction endonuclease subunit S [Priestia megaterium]|uniref:restriction endonuclease subunit S n=1 Tax=Priestia megaterium TaxID=1404 RepID=UPI003009AAF6
MNFLLEQFDTIFDNPKSVNKLKELILDMAVKGKIVPQDKRNETANILLDKIKVEKEQLIKEKKIKKEKPLLPILEEEIPYELPEGWEWGKLGDMCYLITDGTHSTPNYVESGIPFLSVKDISKGFIDFNNTRYISEEEHKELTKRCNPEYQNILLTKIGTTGIAQVIDTTREFSIFVSVALLKFNSDYIFPYYLQHVINSPLVREQSAKNTKGVGNKNLVLKYIKNFLIPIPPLEEQKRIVEKVDYLVDFCEKLKQQLEKKKRREDKLNISIFNSLEQSLTIEELKDNLEFLLANLSSLCTDIKYVQQLRNTILSLAVKGKLVPQDLKDQPASMLLEEIKKEKEQLIKDKKIKKAKALQPITEEEKTYVLPKGWEWVKIGEIFDVGTGSTPLKGNNLYYEGGQIPWVTSSATGEDYITSTQNYITDFAIKDCNLRVYPQGTLVVALYGQGKTRGQISELLIEATTNQACACLFNISGNPLIKNYVKMFFKKIYNEIRMLAVGGAQPNLNGLKIKNTLIALPPLEEQKRILEKVHNLMNVCDELEEKIKNADEQKENLLQTVLHQVLYKQGIELVEA